jgi:prevent-host-death family protein
MAETRRALAPEVRFPHLVCQIHEIAVAGEDVELVNIRTLVGRCVAMERSISVAEASRNFSQILQRVRQGRSYLITSRGKPVARISPVDKSEKIRVQTCPN